MPVFAPRLLLVVTAILFSTGGAVIKATSLNGWQVGSFRAGIAAIALALAIPGARRGWTWSLLPVGAAYASTLVLFALSNRLTTAADAIFLQSTAPLYLLLLGPWLLHEALRRSDVILMVALAVGLSLFFLGSESAQSTAPDPARGNILAVASGVTWAFTILGLRWHGKRVATAQSPLAPVVAGNVIACLVCLPMAWPVTGAGPRDAAVILHLGLFQVGLAYFLLTRAIRHVPAFEASTILLIEPALNPIWAWMLHGERISALAAAGGAIILVSTLLATLRQTSSAGAAAP